MATTTTRMKFVSDRKRREKGGASYLLCVCVYVCMCVCVLYLWLRRVADSQNCRPWLAHCTAKSAVATHANAFGTFDNNTIVESHWSRGSYLLYYLLSSETSPAGMRILSSNSATTL